MIKMSKIWQKLEFKKVDIYDWYRVSIELLKKKLPTRVGKRSEINRAD